jgi:hypothetical protein
MSRTLKDRLTAIGLDASHYGWHSWRRGGTTAMFAAGEAENPAKSTYDFTKDGKKRN